MLFKHSFCSERCHSLGESFRSAFEKKSASSDAGYKGDYPLEELAFISLAIKREEEQMSPMKRLICEAKENFNLLSEQLSFLEMKTGERWYAGKMYYHFNKSK